MTFKELTPAEREALECNLTMPLYSNRQVNFLTISNCVSINMETGQVTLLNQNVDEAAKEFWRAVERMYPIWE